MPSVETQHGGSMADVFYSWQQVYRNALNEPDTTKLTEMQAIREAAKKLMEVKIERLKWVAPNINDFQLPKVANPRLPLNYRKAG
jgi:hypothetical protein